MLLILFEGGFFFLSLFFNGEKEEKKARGDVCVSGVGEILNISNRTLITESSSLHSPNDLTMALSLEILFPFISIIVIYIKFTNLSRRAFDVCFVCLSSRTYVCCPFFLVFV
jgi:hypothetical protein